MAAVYSEVQVRCWQDAEPQSPVFRTLAYAPCPYCGKTEFNAVTHRRNHVAKCDLEQLPPRYREAAKALKVGPVADAIPATDRDAENAAADRRIDEYRRRSAIERAKLPRAPYREEI